MAGKVRGIDGGWYDNAGDALAADRRYRQQQTQNRLLEEQNRLIKEQALENERNARREREAQRERLQYERETQKELQNMKMKHEEKMRILRLFDDIGLNKTYYENFMVYLFGPNIDEVMESLFQMQMKKITYEDVIKNIDAYCKNHEEGYEAIKNLLLDDSQKQSIINKKYELNMYLENPYDVQGIDNIIEKLNLKDNEEFKDLEKQSKNHMILGGVSIALEFVVIFGFCALFADAGDDAFLVLILIACMLCAFGVYHLLAGTNRGKVKLLKKLVQEEINNIDKKINAPINHSKIEQDLLKMKEYVKEDIKNLNKEITCVTKLLDGIETRWNEFVEFRKNHYNSQFEKLLLDLNLKEQIENVELEYPKINNSNKLGDGTIEDYIAYFDERC